MANYEDLKTAVAAVVKTNGENSITGANLQSTLLSIIGSVGANYTFAGIASPSSSPGTPDQNVFWIGIPGTYTNFGDTYTVERNHLGIFRYNGVWTNRSIELFTDNAIGDQYSHIDMSNVIYDKYIDTSGTVQSYTQSSNKYYYTQPILFKAGQGIFLSWDDNGMGGMAFISKASGSSDTGPYTPIEGMERGDSSNTKGSKLYCVREDGYYVISFRDTIYNAYPVITSYGMLGILENMKADMYVGSDFYLTEKPNIYPTFNYKGLITACKVKLNTQHTNSNSVGYFGATGTSYVNSTTKIFTLSLGEMLVVNTISKNISKISGEDEMTEGDRIIAKLLNTGFVGELCDVFNEQLWSYPYATRRFLDPSDMVMDAYISTTGSVLSYADYYYSNPVELSAGTIIAIQTIGSGLALICKTDASGTDYDPVVIAPSGVSSLKIYTYYVREGGYYAFSGWFTDKVMFVTDSIISSMYDNLTQDNAIVPSYYESYMGSKAEDILDAVNVGGEYQDAFAFVTDTHLLANAMASPSLISFLTKKSYIDKTVFGGDFVGTFNSSDADTAKEEIKQEMSMQLGFPNAMAHGAAFYSVHGNHDITDLYHYGLSRADVRYAMLQRGTSERIITNEDDPKGNYYCFDNDKAHIRYVIFDSTPVNDGSSSHATSYGVDPTQMSWIISEAILNAPSGYNFVFIVHVPVVQNASSDSSWSNYSNVRTLCDAVKNKKSSVTIGGSTYDFSGIVGDLIIVIGGHTHGDLETYVDGVLHVSTACDAFYPTDTRYYSLWGNSNFARTRGTDTEQLLDIVCVQPSNSVVKMIRVGAGYSRTFHLTAISVSAGSTVTLTPSVTADNWYISDSSGLTYGKISPATYPIPTNNVATISNGVVSGLVAGEAIACASDDDNLTREFFYIKVV